MSPELSRRVGRAMGSPAVLALPVERRAEIGDLVDAAARFADLPPWLRDAVLAAELSPAAVDVNPGGGLG